ncbi:TetR/AcrR family transcriptional regulator [Paenibacillus sp. PL91]|uniref:TetR/AcrR family transcriptional regulator n=1 Tax=Paenibacillus sp. PL91 TaxID=2729538 RepID=UPI00145F8C1A|nr:TetR/AcrR family transcriptional regulator [Paenibacillus sp. PL91]MBC9199413.1 TetR/AcrR family transcriptional regulator [Paenibacillus sp. PL91]
MSDEQIKRKPGRPKGTGSIQTMQQILRTAAYLFMEQGFEKVSLDGVAQACGVTKASVYYYFNNKSILFTECLQFVLKMAYDQTAKLVQGPGTLKERMLNVAERHMNNAHVEFETMMREASSGLSEEQVTSIRTSENAIHELIASVFQIAMDEGEIMRGDSLLLAHVFTAMLTVRNRKEIINSEKTVEQAAAEIVELLWTGLVPRSKSI